VVDLNAGIVVGRPTSSSPDWLKCLVGQREGWMMYVSANQKAVSLNILAPLRRGEHQLPARGRGGGPGARCDYPWTRW
jgi:hypothetical protein